MWDKNIYFEKFYHGFVPGPISELRDTYEIKSGHECGYGRYDAELTARGIGVEWIRHYGFAFEGKKVLIMG